MEKDKLECGVITVGHTSVFFFSLLQKSLPVNEFQMMSCYKHTVHCMCPPYILMISLNLQSQKKIFKNLRDDPHKGNLGDVTGK